MPRESALFSGATLSGKPSSKSDSHGSWCTTVVTPQNRFFQAPSSRASRRSRARPSAMRPDSRAWMSAAQA